MAGQAGGRASRVVYQTGTGQVALPCSAARGPGQLFGCRCCSQHPAPSQLAAAASRPALRGLATPPARACGAVEGLMHLAPACSAWLFLGSVVLEFRKMWAAGAFSLILQVK